MKTFGIAIIFLILTAHIPIQAQECSPQRKGKSLGIFISGDVTYIGYSTVVGLTLEKNKHSLYLGPKISITDTYLPNKGPFGGNIGYRYYFLNNLKRWSVFVNLDYQAFVYRSFKAQGEKSKHKNYLHEINFSYGVQLRLWEKLFIGNSIGLGKYYESYYSHNFEKRTKFSGYDALIRFFINYRIYDK